MPQFSLKRSALNGAIEQLDRHAFGPPNEADAHAGPHGSRLPSELDALGLEIRSNRVDAGHGKSEVVETAVWRGWSGVSAVTGRDRGDENIGGTDLQIDARLAFLHMTDD